MAESSLNPQKELGAEQIIDFSIKMRNAALDSAERRQAYEWKFCTLVWTAIGGLIGILLVNNLILDREKLSINRLLLLGSLILFVVAFFQIFCWLSNQVDKRRSEMYEDVINEALKINKTKKLIRAKSLIRWTYGFWAPFSQIVLTFTLLFAFWCVCPASQNAGEKECCNDNKSVVRNTAEVSMICRR